MKFYADLHIHSKHSRATSRDCDLENLAYWGLKKGITVIGTGDFTHPAWMKELQEKLIPAEPGLFRLRPEIEKAIFERLPHACRNAFRFLLSVEISTIYKKGEKTRKVHHLLYAPDFEKALKINQTLSKIGNLKADGRPILGLDSRDLLEITLHAGEGCFLVPAHVWTPWFSIFGSKSGFDHVSECYEDLAPEIFALETGLSSDPAMNRRISELDAYRLISNSDAHSPPKLGREANLLNTELNYFSLKKALQTGQGFEGTIEFFPEEGKYHFDGHRACGIRLSPEESKAQKGICPVCKKPLTLGVLYRVSELEDRIPKSVENFQNLIPLPEILSEILQVGPQSKTVAQNYEKLISTLGSEFSILKEIPVEDLKSYSPLFCEGIQRMREGKVKCQPGFDGEYGMIRLFEKSELS